MLMELEVYSGPRMCGMAIIRTPHAVEQMMTDAFYGLR